MCYEFIAPLAQEMQYHITENTGSARGRGMHKKGGGLLQPRAEREMPNAHGGGELEDEKGG